MSALDELFHLYAAWKQLTLQEQAALTCNRWEKVEQFQRAKIDLQQAILARSEELSDDFDRDPARRAILGAQIEYLIQIERENLRLLGLRRQEAETKRSALAKESRVLGQLRHSYVPPRPQAWCSYS